MTNSANHNLMANALRILSLDSVEKAKSGHLGLPLGAADIVTVLFSKFLNFDPKDAHWPNRDRFVLSAGHGSVLLYSLLHLVGYEDIPLEELKNFRQLGSKTAGHPEFGHLEGIETTTGPLGQGLANAVGMAIAETRLAADFGDTLVDHFTYALVGDGCLMEGISHEAASLAGHLALNKLIVFWDDNNITIDGYVSIADSTDQVARFKSYGWNIIKVDGHNAAEISAAVEAAKTSDKPTLIACKTIAGFGGPTRAGVPKAHGGPYGAEEAAGIRKALDWTTEPFVVPEDVVDDWRLAGLRSTKKRVAWEDQLAGLDPETAAEFARRLRGDLPTEFDQAISDLKQTFTKDRPTIATRKASQITLETINAVLGETVGGSADLNGSNLTKTSNMSDYSAQNRDGRFINFGVREHAMAAILNGLALHGGILPYAGGFFVFSDYARPAIRLAALMNIRTIHVMTHDSIGVGEDGPTHQPVEHFASFRAMPGIKVYRPADAIETAECWQLAIRDKTSPSILALTRQSVELVRVTPEEKNLSQRGAYVIEGESGDEAVIFATGSELGIALAAAKMLRAKNIPTRVVSIPCFELFLDQGETYFAQIIGAPKARVAVEAGVRQGWDRLLGEKGQFVGMTGFGASAPGADLYQHFSITPDAVVEAVLKQL